MTDDKPRRKESASVKAKKVFPDDPAIVYSGYAHLSLTHELASFDRKVKDSPFAADSPCATVAFRTNAALVQAEIEYADKRDLPGHHTFNSTGVCLVDGEARACFTRSDDAGGRQHVKLAVGGERGQFRDVEIILPIADRVSFRGLSVEAAAEFHRIHRKRSPVYVAYGDSITQGFWASDPTRTFPYLLAKAKGWQLVNMGFGGRCVSASDVFALARLKPDILTVLIGVNDCLGCTSLDDFAEECSLLLYNIRFFRHGVPIVVITPLSVPGKWEGTESLERYREVLRRAVQVTKDEAIHLVEGPDLIPSDLQYFHDGLHPNDAGFRLMAERFAARFPRT